MVKAQTYSGIQGMAACHLHPASNEFNDHDRPRQKRIPQPRSA